MRKHLKEIIVFLAFGPLFPSPAAALAPVTTANAYMVENTSGTDTSGNFCYDFQTKPTCSARITNLSSSTLAGGSTQYIQNTLTPTTTTQKASVFNLVVTSNTIMRGTTVYNDGTISNTNGITTLGAVSANNFNSTGSTPPNNGWTTSAANTVTFYTATTPVLTLTSAQNVTIPNTLTVSTITTSSATITLLSVGTITFTSDGSKQNTAFLGNVMPTVQRFLSGSGTYTVPSSPRLPLYIRVTMVGAGGGGGGGGTSSNVGNSGSANTTFLAGSASAGVGGGGSQGSTGGTGGVIVITPSATVIVISSITGGQGQGAIYLSTSVSQGSSGGGLGGSTFFGGGAQGAINAATGSAGRANTGEGGQGGGSGTTGANNFTGTGGGGGAYLDYLVSVSSAAAYTYGIGTGGAGGTSTGGGGGTGGAGASGGIFITEYYQ